MSGAGKGTPRVSPFGSAPTPGTAAEDFIIGVIPVPTGPWQYLISTDAEVAAQTLTTTYAVVGENTYQIPLGGVRGSLYFEYTPGEVGSKLASRVLWREGANNLFVLETQDIGDTDAVATAGVATAEIDTYVAAKRTPAAADTTLRRVIVPFWIPSILPSNYDAQELRTAFVNMRVEVREAATVGTQGTVRLKNIIIESFGEAAKSCCYAVTRP